MVERITQHSMTVLVRAESLDRITSTRAVALLRQEALDNVSANRVTVLYKGRRYILGDLLPLTIGPGQKIEMTIVAVDDFKGEVPATIEITSNAVNRPTYKLRINSRVD